MKVKTYKPRLIERILNRIVVGPVLEVAKNRKWELTNSHGDHYVIPIGIVVERRETTTARSFIIGPYRITTCIDDIRISDLRG